MNDVGLKRTRTESKPRMGHDDLADVLWNDLKLLFRSGKDVMKRSQVKSRRASGDLSHPRIWSSAMLLGLSFL